MDRECIIKNKIKEIIRLNPEVLEVKSRNSDVIIELKYGLRNKAESIGLYVPILGWYMNYKTDVDFQKTLKDLIKLKRFIKNL